MASVVLALADVWAFYLHVLERTGAAARLSWLVIPLDPALRPFWAVVVAGSAVFLLYSALAAGDDLRVRLFRAVNLLTGTCLPLAALRTQGGPWRIPLGGAVLVGLLLAGLVHRGLSGARRRGTAERWILRVRWGVEAAGLLLFGIAAFLVASKKTLPVRPAFWGLFLLRLSVADLADPARLASAVGLSGSAARDLRTASGAGRQRRARLPSRLGAALRGALKGSLVFLWISLPLLAALAPGEVAEGTWPSAALGLTSYPAAALGLTALLLAAGALRGARQAPLDAARALIVAAATGLSLWAAFRLPEWETWRHSLSGLYLSETLFAFLLGAASRRP